MNRITYIDRKECPVCKSTKNDVHISFPEIPVVACSECGLFYSSRVFKESDITSYYGNSFGSQRHMQGQIVNAKINSWVISQLIDLQNIKTVLDVGTGYGFLLSELKKLYALDTVGVELSTQEAKFAQDELGVNVINKSLNAAGLKKNSFDLVVSFEVIEHILNPVEFVCELKEYVKPGGNLLIMTDNFGSRMAQSLEAGFPKWIPHSHITHFSSATLKMLLEMIPELSITKSMSYTPWEILLRDSYYKFRGIKKTPSEAFDLETTLESEMSGQYKMFYLRKLLNKLWAQLTLSEKMDGDLIYFLSRRVACPN